MRVGAGVRQRASAALAGAAEDERWSLAITPYLLLPGVDATLGFDAPAGDPGVDTGPSDVLSLINLAVMLKAEARRERAFVLVDWIYLDMGEVDSVVRSVELPGASVPVGASLTVDSDASFDGYTVMLAGGYRALERDAVDLEVYGGVRTLNLTVGLRWALTAAIVGPGGGTVLPIAGELGADSETWDGLIGARGAWRFAEDWRAFGVADHGWGHGSASWQAELGVGWEHGATSVELAWRELGWEGLGHDGDGRLRLYGPSIGATFRF